LNQLEASFLQLLCWRLQVSEGLFEQYRAAVIHGDRVVIEHQAALPLPQPTTPRRVANNSPPAKAMVRRSAQKPPAPNRSWPKPSPPRRSPPVRSKVAKASPGGLSRSVRSAGKRVGLWGSPKRGVAVVRLCRAASRCLTRAVLPNGTLPAPQ
jgi:hypothetical protein